MPSDPTPLARKLKLPAASRPIIIGTPPEQRDALAAALGRPVGDAIDGRHDWILLFARDRAALDRAIAPAAAALEDGGILWLTYPKGSSKIQTD
jgi:hypothetical protein